MGERDKKDAVDKIREEVGAKFRTIRTTGLKLSQEKFGQDVPLLEGKNLQVRIAALEKGNGSTATVYTVMQYLYDRGVNINYLFGEQETLLRISQQASLYPENISDYLEDMIVTAGKARAIITEIITSTERVEQYVQQTVKLAEREPVTKQSNSKSGKK